MLAMISFFIIHKQSTYWYEVNLDYALLLQGCKRSVIFFGGGALLSVPRVCCSRLQFVKPPEAGITGISSFVPVCATSPWLSRAWPRFSWAVP
jgi:hypothetical protein